METYKYARKKVISANYFLFNNNEEISIISSSWLMTELSVVRVKWGSMKMVQTLTSYNKMIGLGNAVFNATLNNIFVI